VGVSSDDAAVGDRDELLRSLQYGFEQVVGKSVLISEPLDAG